MSLSNLKTNFNLDLANPTYQGERNFLIKVAENNLLRLYPNVPTNLKPHLDSVNRLAIGYGYDLEKNKTNVVADFAKIGITLDSHAISIISNLTGSTTAAVRDQLSQYLVLPNETAATSLMEIAANARELTFQHFLDTNGISLGQSCERAALMSMWYQTAAYFRVNGDDTHPTNLGTALITGNRAEAWYEIRYSSSANGTDGLGVVDRRFAESEVFSLYYDKNNVTKAQAQQVYQTYTEHQAKIESYEKDYGLWKGIKGVKLDSNGRTGIEAANADYHLTGTDQVKNIIQELTPAATALETAYLKPNGLTLAHENINPLNIQTAYAGHLNLTGENTTVHTGYINDLLIGNANANTLDGGKGNDVLIAQGGNDKLIGGIGIGNDTLIGSAGTDTLVGGLGDDTYRVRLGSILTENVGEGKDTVIIGDNLLTVADFKNVENLQLPDTRTMPLTIKVNDLVNLALSKNADNVTLDLNKAQTEKVVINTGAGADTIHFKSPIVGSNHQLNFADLSAADKIDLSAFAVQGIATATGSLIIPLYTTGFYLMAPSSVIHVADSTTPDFSNTSANWELKNIAADPAFPFSFTKIDFIGNFAESNFQIA